MRSRPPASRWLFAVILAAAFGRAGPAPAQDPSLRWYTLTTPHFHVHYHEGLDALGQRVGRTAERALARVAAALDHTPAGRIELIVADGSDSANGLASVLPYNHVLVLPNPPADMSELQHYDDHIWVLLLHELTHIVHMDTIRGLPAWVNRVFGRTVYPNGAQPGWFTEGLAVFNESDLSRAGRIRSSLFRMYLRTAVLADRLPALDRMGGSLLQWPQGTVWYLYGGFFVDFIARRYGAQVLTALSHRMSGMLVPWALNTVARQELGASYLALHRQWRRTLERRCQRLLERLQVEGLTRYRRLTRRGQRQLRPRISPGGGQVLYYSAPTDAWPRLRLIARDGRRDRTLIEVNSGGGASFGPDGRYVVYSQVGVIDGHYRYDDLYRLDLETGRSEQLTEGARARDPDVGPAGRRVVFVRTGAGRSGLAMLRLPERTIRQLTPMEPRRHCYTPRLSPDGRRVVYSRARGDGGRDLVLLDMASGAQRVLLADGASNLQPVFSADGRRVLFSSDRTGIYNLYALDPADGTRRRLTNLATGAFSPEPAPDGSGLAFVIYGVDGYDIAWLQRPLPPLALDAPPGRPAPPDRAESVAVDDGPPAAEAEFPVGPYRPWWTLLPRSWLPTWGRDAWGTTLGLLIGSSDAIGKLSYLLGLEWSLARNQLYFDANLTARLFYPSVALYAGRHVHRLWNQAAVNGRPRPIDREEIVLFGELRFPFPEVRSHQSLFVNIDGHFYDRWTEVPLDPLDMQPQLPDDSPLVWLGVGWSGSRTERYLDSISTEKGIAASLSLRLSHPGLGSGSRLAEARLWLRAYWPVVPDWHHVLAFGMQAGMAIGDERRRGLYTVGGLPLRDPLRDATFGYRYSGLYLRGYPAGAFSGSAYWLAGLEYRLPLWRIRRGLWTLPVFVEDLHAAAFVDAGGAAAEPAWDRFVDEMLHVGLGAELRLDLLLAYYLPFSVRLGYGRGLDAAGTDNWYLVLGTGY